MKKLPAQYWLMILLLGLISAGITKIRFNIWRERFPNEAAWRFIVSP